MDYQQNYCVASSQNGLGVVHSVKPMGWIWERIPVWMGPRSVILWPILLVIGCPLLHFVSLVPRCPNPCQAAHYPSTTLLSHCGCFTTVFVLTDVKSKTVTLFHGQCAQSHPYGVVWLVVRSAMSHIETVHYP
jgi:hypothetical protein